MNELGNFATEKKERVKERCIIFKFIKNQFEGTRKRNISSELKPLITISHSPIIRHTKKLSPKKLQSIFPSATPKTSTQSPFPSTAQKQIKNYKQGLNSLKNRCLYIAIIFILVYINPIEKIIHSPINIMQLDLEVKQELEQRFIFKSLLGKGSFGAVYECEDKRDGQTYAVKIISKSNVKKSKMKCLREEARLLSSINHPNIVKVYEFVETDLYIYLQMEYIKNGTLQKFIKNRWESGAKFTDEEMATIMRAIFQSLHYIHSINIIHRDIKPQNILIPSLDDLSQIKMADFGLSTKLDFFYPKTATSKCGTMLFMAPEILNNLSYSKSVDIWSCSIIMFLLAKGVHPFYKSKMTTEQYKTKIKTIIFQTLPDKLFNDFMHRISKVDPNQRYTTQEALKHPWLTRNLDDEIPQSLHEAFLGFEKSHSISNLFKLLLTTRFLITDKGVPAKQLVPQSYILKKSRQSKEINDLNSRRGCKTAWKKERGNCVEESSELSKNSVNVTQNASMQTLDLDKTSKISKQTETESPAIIKLNKIFDSLLDRKNRKKQYRFYTDNSKAGDNIQAIKSKLTTESSSNLVATQLAHDSSSKLHLLPSINKQNTGDKLDKLSHQRIAINATCINRSKNQSIVNGCSYAKNTFSPMTPCYKRAQKQSPPKFIQHKQKLQKQIERLVREYKTDSSIDKKEKSGRNTCRKMLPQNKREFLKNENADKFLGEKNQFRGLGQKQSLSSSTNSSYGHKVRYRKKAGSALRLYD